MIATQQVRIILDRNQNGLDGLDNVGAGQPLAPGIYWDAAARRVVTVESSRPADQALVLLSERLDVTFDELVRKMAMGGGGHSGRAVPYHLGAGATGKH